jgi:acyl-CoA thioesterase-1
MISGTPAAAHIPVILDFGDSLTAGYGLAPEQAFPQRLEAALRRQGTEVRVLNGGVSGDTTAGGLARLGWAVADKPDLVILALGANDALRGIAPAAVRDNLDKVSELLTTRKFDSTSLAELARLVLRLSPGILDEENRADE